MKELKHAGRRAFLKGVGTTLVSLPLLEFTHGHAFAGGERPKRFIVSFEHGGTISNIGIRPLTDRWGVGFFDGTTEAHGEDWWKPADPGESLVLGPIMEPLERWRSKLLVLEGVDSKAAIEQDPYGRGEHRIANVTALTQADVEEFGSGDDAGYHALGPSIDEVLAERLSATQPARFRRIHLMVRGHQYGTPFFRTAREPAHGETSPRAAFDTLFEGVTADGGPDPEVIRARLRRRSILDGVLEGFARFRGVVSRADLHVVDAHLEHLRSIERELESLDMPAMCVPPAGIGADDTADGDVVGPLHAEILVAALRCGLTHVACLEVADILTPWTTAGLRVDSAFGIGHSLGHYARDIGPEGASPELHDLWFEEMLDNRRWRMGLVARILEGLDDPLFAEGGVTMLDSSLLLHTSEFREPAGHVSFNMPVLLAGSAGGAFRTGRHLDYNQAAVSFEYDSPESMHNLFTSILQAFGQSDDHFGSDHARHRGTLPGLV
jgi:hypothetical protein